MGSHTPPDKQAYNGGASDEASDEASAALAKRVARERGRRAWISAR